MWRKQGLQDLLQNMKKVISACFVIMFMGICITGCGTESLTEQQIDEILVYTSHYAREVPEITASITDEASIMEITQFFDGLECRVMTDADTPVEDYDGGGWDVISFKRNGEVVEQYTINCFHICEEEPGAPYITSEPNKDITWEDFAEKIHARTWFILPLEDSATWQEYTNKIVAGELGTIVE